MAQERKKVRVFVIVLLLFVYFVLASRPITHETVLVPKWLSSLESDLLVPLGGSERPVETLLPFALSDRFGYVDSTGRFPVNKTKNGEIYLCENQWTEYGAIPDKIEIMNISSEVKLTIEAPGGYPILLDDRVFILGSDQNMLSEIDKNGKVMWTYEFGAPITCIDAAGGLVLTGTIDGVVEILGSDGARIFVFEPGGSRYSIILGCALSSDGLRAGIVSGINEQRFLVLESYAGGEYRVIYHEFLGGNFRRPVHILFVDQDRRIVYERPEGIGYFNIKTRKGLRIPLSGSITAIENSGDDGFFFLINSYPDNRKELIGIKFPRDSVLPLAEDGKDVIFLNAPFRSGDVFLGRNKDMLIVGGGKTLISYELEKK